MKNSKSEQIQQFLEDIAMLEDNKFDILQALRAIVFQRYPKVTERIIYGGIMFSLEGDFGGIFVSKKHVSFEFGDGYQFNDPKKRLEGSGKFRRHLKIKSLAEIKEKDVDYFVGQAA